MEYREVQRFRSQRLVTGIILAIAAFQWYTAYMQLIVGEKVGNRPAPDLMIVLFWIVFGVIMPWIFFIGGMKTEVMQDGLHLTVVPLPICSKHFHYADIESYTARQYRPLREFGGWGIRFSLSGKAYTISGNQGLQIVFKNGKRLLIGSQHPKRLLEAIHRIIPNSNSEQG